MAKPEWGTKRTCPKCGTRFYDLQKDDPVVCIDCGTEWAPEPILKSRQPVAAEVAKKVVTPKADDDEDDLGLDDDDDIKIDDDDDVTVDTDDDDDDVSAVVIAPVKDDD
ncbi:hypothetical protein JCM17844_13760 [Iodidimonas gelatinilytica]|uniref:TIGR02300 family protein n=1 Tax=Iodidimonas gelatinilytica TaxID=1236966 RepID=A0A5A7MS91_9PROT|nr:FYDLN acid domain-containing protein [Iodidimonas gelatinilytica]GEQ97739.1 hypothetical protein JCM17844_13760 [Iodidimonas gelatinilytica]GER01005.1 hypothetical protein JCM17845_16280 [Iodidimonas gelatinilytica]